MRMRSFIFPLLACGAGAYFGYNLEIGDHGLTARADLERRKEVLEGELAGLDEVKTRLERHPESRPSRRPGDPAQAPRSDGADRRAAQAVTTSPS